MSAGIVPDAAGMNKGFGISSSARTSRSLEETHPVHAPLQDSSHDSSVIVNRCEIDRYHFTSRHASASFPLTVNVVSSLIWQIRSYIGILILLILLVYIIGIDIIDFIGIFEE